MKKDKSLKDEWGNYPRFTCHFTDVNIDKLQQYVQMEVTLKSWSVHVAIGLCFITCASMIAIHNMSFVLWVLEAGGHMLELCLKISNIHIQSTRWFLPDLAPFVKVCWIKLCYPKGALWVQPKMQTRDSITSFGSFAPKQSLFLQSQHVCQLDWLSSH